MKRGYLVKISKRWRKWAIGPNQRFVVNRIECGEVHMIGLEDGYTYFADPEQLVIIGVNRNG